MIILLYFKIFNFGLFGHFSLIFQRQFLIFGILGVKISKNEKFHKIWINVSGKQKKIFWENTTELHPKVRQTCFIFIFSYDDVQNQWIAKHKERKDFQAVCSAGSILGAHEWTVHNDYSTLCNGIAPYTKKLSFSSCTNEKFTCNDGNCIQMNWRWVDWFE